MRMLCAWTGADKLEIAAVRQDSWDFGRRLFLDASIGRQWIDFENAHRPDFSSMRVTIGFR